MAILTWTQENSVGVKDLDLQHQKIFSLINRLHDSMSQNQAHTEIKTILQELVDYANYHFSTEEKYFNQFNFEFKQPHLANHSSYTKHINYFIEKSNQQVGLVLSYEVIDFLEDWWIQHINVEDKKYTQCFNDNGLK